MIDHIELFVSDVEKSTAFFEGALRPLGYTLRARAPSMGFGRTADALDFWLRSGEASTPRPHFAFHCPTREEVRAAHAAALEAGGTDNGAPALLTRIHPHYFAAFVKDPDGHNVEFVCHTAPPVGHSPT